MKKLIVVTDWAGDPLASQEFKSAVEGFLRDPSQTPNISFVPIQPSSIQATFDAFQIVETEERYGRAMETVVFVMTDQRLHGGELELPQGEQLLIARLRSGAYVVGPNALYTFSMIKSKIERVFTYSTIDDPENVDEHVYRSRDVYPKLIAYIMDEMEDDLQLEEVHMDLIPPMQGHPLLNADTFGNLTIYMTKEDMKGVAEQNEFVEVTINDITKQVKYVESQFGDHPGELILYPGTSGDPENPYLQLAIWNGNALQEFNVPAIGTEVKIG